MSITPDRLPSADEAGEPSRRWALPDTGGRDEALQVIEFDGMLLGAVSTHRPGHRGHTPDQPVAKGQRCSGCRWYEVRIFRSDGGHYAVHTVGASSLPNEVNRHRLRWAVSAREVIEILTTRHTQGEQPKIFLTDPAASVLAQATRFDEAILEAYDNRAGV